MVRYHVKLTREEVEQLKAIANKGTHTSHTFKVAYILLNCDEGEYSDKVKNETISKVLKVACKQLTGLRKSFVREVLRQPLNEKKPPVLIKTQHHISLTKI